MTPRDIKRLCRTVAEYQRSGLLTAQQAKTIQGQAKRGDVLAALRGLDSARKKRPAEEAPQRAQRADMAAD